VFRPLVVVDRPGWHAPIYHGDAEKPGQELFSSLRFVTPLENMDLESIPGVGEKTARALSALDDPERALRAGDVEAIATAPGISQGRAARIARGGAIRLEHDDPGGFLATDRAREVYREVLGLLEERTVTDYAARRLETFYPSPRRSRIAEVQEFAREALERDPDLAVLDALEGSNPFESRATCGFASAVWRRPTPSATRRRARRFRNSPSKSSRTHRGWPNSPGGTRR